MTDDQLLLCKSLIPFRSAIAKVRHNPIITPTLTLTLALSLWRTGPVNSTDIDSSGVIGDKRSETDDDNCYCDDTSEAIPWYHMQLYRLYGDEADYLLHPQITGAISERHVSAVPLKLELLKNQCATDTDSLPKNIGTSWDFIN